MIKHATNVGVVLAGGGARGAYEAGALATLLPALEAAGERPRVFVGTSAGAINAVLFASLAHLPAEQTAEQAWAVWASIHRRDVIKPILPSGLNAGVNYLGQMLGLQRSLTGLLNADPLEQTLRHRVNWDTLHDNIEQGRGLHAVAVTATSSHTGRSSVFVEETPGYSLQGHGYHDDTRAIDYIHTHLAPEHVMASAAIPVLFPPIRVSTPDLAAGWYLDGGVRMNAPVKPAITLGVDKLIIIASDPLESPANIKDEPLISPDIYAAISEVLRAALIDRMVEDVHTLRKINNLLQNPQHAGVRAARSQRTYRPIPWLFVGPHIHSHLGKLAELVFQREYGHKRWWRRHWDFPLLHQLVQSDSTRRGELLSYLFFHHIYMREALELGRRDALRLLSGSATSLPWRLLD
ncbi:MAG: hypothetical protein HKM02_02190 [Pseudomonadales bacterium]|nr:hypothetical protein [Pseudomonadales bacterium]